MKQPRDDAPALPDESAVPILPEEEPGPEPEQPRQVIPEPEAMDPVQEILDRPFDSPLGVLPSRRYPKKDIEGKVTAHGVYSVYGRAPKEAGNKEYPKARLRVFEKLPGSWNQGRTRLYVEVHMGEHLREALARAGELEDAVGHPVLSYITQMGSYSHRHIRHNPKSPLSYHSWGIAVDINPPRNRGISYHSTWQKRVKGNGKSRWVDSAPAAANRGPINKVLPFSKQYYDVFPQSMPYELVMAFKSVYFAWGGDWGRAKWHGVVAKFGSRYDQDDAEVANSQDFKGALQEWKSMRYSDGMHFELLMRGTWAAALWAKHQKLLDENVVMVA